MVRLGNRTYRTWRIPKLTLMVRLPDLREYASDNRFRERLGAVRKPHLPGWGPVLLEMLIQKGAVRKPHLPVLEKTIFELTFFVLR